MFSKSLIGVAGFALTAFLALSAAAAPKYGAFTPKGELAPGNAQAFAGYGSAMARHEGYQMAYHWQKANSKSIVAALKEDVLKKFLESPKAADELLAKIGTSYNGDPMALTQIAAVTQLVMKPCNCAKKAKCRKLWVAALERAHAKTDDGYVKVFCDQQLRLCR